MARTDPLFADVAIARVCAEPASACRAPSAAPRLPRSAHQFTMASIVRWTAGWPVSPKWNIDQVIDAPKHPYAQVLLESVPVADPTRRWHDEAVLIGEEARTLAGRERCLFAERCAHRTAACVASRPAEVTLEDG